MMSTTILALALGDDHLIMNGGACQILSGQNIYLRSRNYFRLLQDRLFISGYNSFESGGQARLFFYFLGHTCQIIYFQVFGGQHIYFQNCCVTIILTKFLAVDVWFPHKNDIWDIRSDICFLMLYSVVLRNTHYLVRLFKRLSCVIFVHKLINN